MRALASFPGTPAADCPAWLAREPDAEGRATDGTPSVLARTVEPKYEMAQERSHGVDGLAGFVAALRGVGSTRVLTVLVGAWDCWLVVMTLERDAVLGVLGVRPLPPEAGG